jgi:hypothetical protein
MLPLLLLPTVQERIKAAGGHVFWNGGHRVMGVLSMSRAIGDMYLKRFGVIATPEVSNGHACCLQQHQSAGDAALGYACRVL